MKFNIMSFANICIAFLSSQKKKVSAARINSTFIVINIFNSIYTIST